MADLAPVPSTKAPVRPPILVPSTLFNLQVLIKELHGPGGAALLGAGWGFRAFSCNMPMLCEYDLPVSWPRYAASLRVFSGILLEIHPDDPGEDAYDRLAFGQPVILAVDSFHLPYRPAFGRVNSGRTLLATGMSRSGETVDIRDSWMPAYTGALARSDLDRARASRLPLDMEREPLFAGAPLNRRWWTAALTDAPLIAKPHGYETALALLASQALSGADGGATWESMERSRPPLARVLSGPLRDTVTARRAAALWLRAEVGLRAYLLALFDLAGAVLGDALLAAETDTWAQHLVALSRARDLITKAVVFDNPGYADLVDAELDEAARRERRFLGVVRDLFAPSESLGPHPNGSFVQ